MRWVKVLRVFRGLSEQPGRGLVGRHRGGGARLGGTGPRSFRVL